MASYDGWLIAGCDVASPRSSIEGARTPGARARPVRKGGQATAERGRAALTILLVILLLMVVVPWSSDALAEGMIQVPEGETLVIDTDLGPCGPVLVEGTLVVDGAELLVYDDVLEMIMPSLVRVSGVLRLVNGSSLLGWFDLEILEGGLVELLESSLYAEPSWTGHLITAQGGELRARDSSLTSTHGLYSGVGSNLTLVNSTVTTSTEPVRIDGILSQMSGSVLMVGTTLVADGPGLRAVDTALVTLRDCDVTASNGTAVHVEGSDDITVGGTNITNGTKGLVLDYSRRARVENVTVRGTQDWGCDLSWLGSLSLRDLTVMDCHGVGVNVSNCTELTMEDLTVRRVEGKGIGFTAQYTEPIDGAHITTRGVRQGVLLVYSNRTALVDVDVDRSSQYGMHVSKSSDISIDGLTARTAGADGLYCAYSSNVKVTDAALDGAGECGAFLTHSSVSLTRASATFCGRYGVRAATHSTFLVGCDLSNNGLDGLFSLDQGGVGLRDCSAIGNHGDGVRFLNAESPAVKNCTLAYNEGAGVHVHYMTKDASVDGCRIEGNGIGILLNGPVNLSGGCTLQARQCMIFDNDEAGALNWEQELTLDAAQCWWGNNTGPTNASRNKNGSGDEIFGGVKFKPWLKLGNLPPVVEGPTELRVDEGAVEDFPYTAYDYDDEDTSLRFHLEGAPGNVTINELDGWLRVRPEDAEVGNWTFRVVALDPMHGIGRLKVHLEVVGVNDPPTILVPAEGYHVGDDEEFAFALRATDPDSDPSNFTWRLLQGPEWLAVLADGTVTGISTVEHRGEHTFEVEVDDGDGGTDAATVRLVVVPHYDIVRLDPVEGQTAYEDRPFRFTFSACCDVDAVLKWELHTAASWLHLETSNQTIWGTPTQGDVGMCSVRVTVADQWGCEVTQVVTISVLPVNDPPEWRDPPEQVVVTTTETSFSLAAHIFDPDDPVDLLTLACDDRHVRFVGSLMVLKAKRGEGPMELTLVLSDPQGANATHVVSVVVDIPPEEVDPPSTASWFPWLLLAVLVALAVGAIHVVRRRRDASGELSGVQGDEGTDEEGEEEPRGGWIPDTVSRPPRR